MNSLMKKGAWTLLFATALTVSFSSCGDDDPFDNVTRPVIKVAPNTLSGVITDKRGEALANATVTLKGGKELISITSLRGVYVFNDVPAGTYELKVEADGKLPQTAELKVEDTGSTQNLQWNAVLATDLSMKVKVSDTEEVVQLMNTEALKGNDEAKVRIETEVPAGAVETTGDEEVSIIVTPIYTDDVTTARRAAEPALLVGAAVKCSKEGALLKNAIDLAFHVDASMTQVVKARMLKNGSWVDAEQRIEGDKVIVSARDFTSFGLFVDVTFAVSQGTTDVKFMQKVWDNIDGASVMQITSASYTYLVGTELNIKNDSDKLSALLIEKLAQLHGSQVVKVNATYMLNVVLPLATKLEIFGSQLKNTISATVGNVTATATTYGAVTVKTQVYNRKHNGGSN